MKVELSDVMNFAKTDKALMLRLIDMGLGGVIGVGAFLLYMRFVLTHTHDFDPLVVEEDDTLYLKGEDDNV